MWSAPLSVLYCTMLGGPISFLLQHYSLLDKDGCFGRDSDN